MQLGVVCRRETHQKGDVDGIYRFRHTTLLQLIGNGEEGQGIEALALGLVTHIGDALLSEGVVLTIPEHIIRLEAGRAVRDDKPSGELLVGCFDGFVAVANGNNHE